MNFFIFCISFYFLVDINLLFSRGHTVKNDFSLDKEVTLISDELTSQLSPVGKIKIQNFSQSSTGLDEIVKTVNNSRFGKIIRTEDLESFEAFDQINDTFYFKNTGGFATIFSTCFVNKVPLNLQEKPVLYPVNAVNSEFKNGKTSFRYVFISKPNPDENIIERSVARLLLCSEEVLKHGDLFIVDIKAFHLIRNKDDEKTYVLVAWFVPKEYSDNHSKQTTKKDSHSRSPQHSGHPDSDGGAPLEPKPLKK